MVHYLFHDNGNTNFEHQLGYWKLLVFLSTQTCSCDKKYAPRYFENNGDMIYNPHVLGRFLMAIHNVYIA